LVFIFLSDVILNNNNDLENILLNTTSTDPIIQINNTFINNKIIDVNGSYVILNITEIRFLLFFLFFLLLNESSLNIDQNFATLNFLQRSSFQISNIFTIQNIMISFNGDSETPFFSIYSNASLIMLVIFYKFINIKF